MSLSTLPNELLLIIAGYLPQECELNTLARTNTRLYAIFDSLLYQRDASQFRSYALHRAIMDNSENTVLKALQHGAYIGPLKVGPDERKDIDIDPLSNDERHDGRIESDAINPFRSPIRVRKRRLSPLIEAVKRQRVEIVRLLLAAGADPIGLHDSGDCPILVLAAKTGNATIVTMLLERGVEVDHRINFNYNALLVAAKEGHEGVVRALVNAGADPLIRDRDGKPLLNWAGLREEVSLIRSLKSEELTLFIQAVMAGRR
ncbi:hypothetical protein MW887_004617 [Aspergillus wentii]|nr:hypothetical protein MW887_004617 [Aspergillus wentii]